MSWKDILSDKKLRSSVSGMKGYCPTKGQKWYPTKEEAEKPILGKKQKATYCKDCGWYHAKPDLPSDYREQWKKKIEEQLGRLR